MGDKNHIVRYSMFFNEDDIAKTNFFKPVNFGQETPNLQEFVELDGVGRIKSGDITIEQLAKKAKEMVESDHIFKGRPLDVLMHKFVQGDKYKTVANKYFLMSAINLISKERLEGYLDFEEIKSSSVTEINYKDGKVLADKLFLIKKGKTDAGSFVQLAYKYATTPEKEGFQNQFYGKDIKELIYVDGMVEGNKENKGLQTDVVGQKEMWISKEFLSTAIVNGDLSVKENPNFQDKMASTMHEVLLKSDGLVSDWPRR